MRSMTGFGRGEATVDQWKLEVELSGVNRKQIDVSVNLPSALSELEGDVRKRVTGEISRGRISVRVNLEHTGNRSAELAFDKDLARQYIEAAGIFSELGDIESRLTAADLFRAPGLFRLEDAEVEAGDLREGLLEAVENALTRLGEMQQQEGEHLREDLIERLNAIEGESNRIRQKAPEVPETYRENLMKRLRDKGLEIDLNDDRVLKEIGLFADRCDISEELTRIDSHLAQFRSYLESDEPVGRPLDFLCQEFNRELNTIGSKANDAEIAQGIVRSKTELEKIREQVQNVQ
ncbi:MAG: YicC family protein [Verrucomicrobiales bacterium]|nr:YicC family protein [Verrucomicrobiales bacterium]